MYACLDVTCHLHFWQNDRGLLRATAVTRSTPGLGETRQKGEEMQTGYRHFVVIVNAVRVRQQPGRRDSRDVSVGDTADL